MPYYLAIYANNDVVSVVETPKETEEKTISHDDGLLIFAIIKAETESDAKTIATGIGSRQKALFRA
jgi:hypothetical protein